MPDPPPGLCRSVAMSADFPASGEHSCCNFALVRAVNNILCRAASHTAVDAHIGLISGSGSASQNHSTLHWHHGGYMMKRQEDGGGGSSAMARRANGLSLYLERR